MLKHFTSYLALVDYMRTHGFIQVAGDQWLQEDARGCYIIGADVHWDGQGYRVDYF